MSDDRWRTATEELAKELGRLMSPLGYSQTIEECVEDVREMKRHLTKVVDELKSVTKTMPRDSRMVTRIERTLASLRCDLGTEGDLLDLLRKLAAGAGGRRTGELQRRGWLRWAVTPEGHAVLASIQEDAD